MAGELDEEVNVTAPAKLAVDEGAEQAGTSSPMLGEDGDNDLFDRLNTALAHRACHRNALFHGG